MSDDYSGIATDKTIATTETVIVPDTVAGGDDQSRPSGEENTGDSNS